MLWFHLELPSSFPKSASVRSNSFQIALSRQRATASITIQYNLYNLNIRPRQRNVISSVPGVPPRAHTKSVGSKHPQ
jgi:hypothetical protein